MRRQTEELDQKVDLGRNTGSNFSRHVAILFPCMRAQMMRIEFEFDLCSKTSSSQRFVCIQINTCTTAVVLDLVVIFDYKSGRNTVATATGHDTSGRIPNLARATCTVTQP